MRKLNNVQFPEVQSPSSDELMIKGVELVTEYDENFEGMPLETNFDVFDLDHCFGGTTY